MKIGKISFLTRVQIFAAAELALIMAYSLLNNVMHDDSGTYLWAWDVLKQGGIDDFRTPVYPIVCGVLSEVFGPRAYKPILYIIQSGLFLLSIRWMWAIMRAMVPNKRVVKWFTAIYALYPGPLAFCSLEITESLSLAAVTGLLYLVVQVVRERSARAAWWTVPLLTGLVMLRPVFIYIVGCLMVFWLAALIMRRGGKAVWISLVGCVLAVGVIAAYSWEMKRQHGFYATSIVADINGYYTLRESRVLRPGEASDPDVRRFIDRQITDIPDFICHDVAINQATCEVSTFRRGFGDERLHEFVREEMVLHPGEIAWFLVRYRLLYILEDECVYGGYSIPPVRVLTKPFAPNNGVAMLMFTLVVILLGRQYFRQRKTDALLWLFCLLFVAIYVTVWVSAQSEWPRLLLPNYPVLLTLGAWLTARVSYYFMSTGRGGCQGS